MSIVFLTLNFCVCRVFSCLYFRVYWIASVTELLTAFLDDFLFRQELRWDVATFFECQDSKLLSYSLILFKSHKVWKSPKNVSSILIYQASKFPKLFEFSCQKYVLFSCQYFMSKTFGSIFGAKIQIILEIWINIWIFAQKIKIVKVGILWEKISK